MTDYRTEYREGPYLSQRSELAFNPDRSEHEQAVDALIPEAAMIANAKLKEAMNEDPGLLHRTIERNDLISRYFHAAMDELASRKGLRVLPVKRKEKAPA